MIELFAALAVLMIYVGMSQSAMSLLGRDVPVRWLDPFLVEPHHRTGMLRYLGLVFTIGVSTGVQVLMVWALFHQLDGDPGWPYLVEPFGAVVWTSWLIRAARSPRR